MKLVIEIDEEVYNHMKERFMYGYADTEVDKVCLAVSNGKTLPKWHGRLGDLDALQKEVSSWGMNDYEPSDFIDEISNADTIIEADKKYEVEIITRGNCMMCGKELTEGLFFCKECEEKGESEVRE